jgi:type IV secretion system protein VirD4
MLVVLGACLLFGCWCAAQYVAAQLGHAARLGPPAFVLSPALHFYARALASVGVGAVLLVLLHPRSRPFAPLLGVVAATLFIATRGPVYGPLRFPLWMMALRDDPAVAAALGGARIAFAVGSFAAVVAITAARRGAGLRQASTSFGTSRWGDAAQLADAPEGLPLGRRLDDGAMLRHASDGHLITVSPTGGGKGTSAVVPALLSHPGSIIVPDVKPELYAITQRHRRELGKVACIDPWNQVKGGDGLNPMDFIDPDSDDALDDSEMVADMLVAVAEQSGKDKHWNEEALAFLTGLVMHVKTTAPPDRRNLPEVRRLLMLPRGTDEEPGAFETMLAEMLSNPAIRNLISQKAAALTQKSSDERSGVISSAQSHTHFLDSPRIQRVLEKTTFNLDELKTGTMTLYVVLPARRLTRYSRLVRLVVGAALLRISAIPGQPKHKILVLLDEFTQLKRLGPVEEAFRLMRGFGVQFWLFLQDLASFEEVYPKVWKSYVANAGVLQAFGTNDVDTAEYLSKRIGETTVFVESENRSRGVSHGKMDNVQEGAGQTTAEKGRRLMMPDEILRMNPEEGMQLIFVQGRDPVLARRIVYYTDPAFAGQFDDNPHHVAVR